MSNFLQELTQIVPTMPLIQSQWIAPDGSAACPVTQFCLQNNIFTAEELLAAGNRREQAHFIVGKLSSLYGEDVSYEMDAFTYKWDSSGLLAEMSGIRDIAARAQEEADYQRDLWGANSDADED